jgi:hypothetical protein
MNLLKLLLGSSSKSSDQASLKQDVIHALKSDNRQFVEEVAKRWYSVYGDNSMYLKLKNRIYAIYSGGKELKFPAPTETLPAHYGITPEEEEKKE